MSISVYNCSFITTINHLNLGVKFPCQIFVEWKESFRENSSYTKHHYKVNEGVAKINEQLSLTVQLVYDEEDRQFIKKQSELIVNLVKIDKPQAINVVGRISVNLADVLNQNQFSQVEKHKLTYCSVKGQLEFKINCRQKKQVQKKLAQISRDSLNQFYTKHPRKKVVVSALPEDPIKKNLNFFNQTFNGTQSHVIQAQKKSEILKAQHQQRYFYSASKSINDGENKEQMVQMLLEERQRRIKAQSKNQELLQKIQQLHDQVQGTFFTQKQKHWHLRQEQLLTQIQQLQMIIRKIRDPFNEEKQYLKIQTQKQIQIIQRMQLENEQYLSRYQQLKLDYKKKQQILQKALLIKRSLQQQLQETKQKVHENLEAKYLHEKQQKKTIESLQQAILILNMRIQEQTKQYRQSKERERANGEKFRQLQNKYQVIEEELRKCKYDLKLKEKIQAEQKKNILELQQNLSNTKLAFQDKQERSRQDRFKALKQKQVEISNLKDQIKQKQEEIQKLLLVEEELRKCNIQIQRLQEQKYSLSILNNQLSETIKNIQESNLKLQENNAQSSITIDVQQQNLNKQTISIDKLKQSLQKATTENNELKKANSELKIQINIQQRTIKENTNDITVLRQQKKQIVDQNIYLKQHIQELNSKIEEIQAKNRDEYRQIVSLKQQNARNEKLKTDFSQKFDQITEKYINLQNLHKKFKEEKETAQNELLKLKQYQLFKQFDPTLIKEFTNIIKQKNGSQMERSILVHLRSRKTSLQKIQLKQQQRSEMQLKARNLSIQFQKFKSFILQSKWAYQQKMNILTGIKSCETYVNQLKALSDLMQKPQRY